MSCDESMRTGFYLCDLCATSKARSDLSTCWCRNKVVEKKVAFGGERAKDVCADFEAKAVKR